MKDSIKNKVMQEIREQKTKKSIMARYDITSLEYKSVYIEYNEWDKKDKPTKKFVPIGGLEDVSRSAKHTCDSLSDTYGVYVLWYDDDIVYVGVSMRLGRRILESFSEKKGLATHFSYIKTRSKSDAYVLEVMFINKYTPIHNKATVGGDSLFHIVLPEAYFITRKTSFSDGSTSNIGNVKNILKRKTSFRNHTYDNVE